MKIAILGATGFIGNAIFHSLVAEHDVVIGSRTPIDGYGKWKCVDFSRENDWDGILMGVDVVINAIGIIEGDFDQIQAKAPLKLFEACISRGIRVVNISAVGAERENPEIPFLKTKKMADDYLLQYEFSRIIYPGIVLGKGSASTRLFVEMAQLPIIPLLDCKPPPAIHILQLTALVKSVVEDFDGFPKQIFAISKPESLERILTAIRGRKGVFLKFPAFLLDLFFSVFPKATIGVFNKSTMNMLSSISADDYKPVCEEASSRINPDHLSKSDYLPTLIALGSLSFIWIWSGISSLISWDSSYGFMKEIGANDRYSVLLIYSGSIADIILGFAVFWKERRRQVLVIQMFFIFLYTMILTVSAPHYWLHPFGVLSKNLSLIALGFYLYRREENRG